MMARFCVLFISLALLLFPGAAQVRLKTQSLRGPTDLHPAPLLRKTPHRSHLVVELETMPGAAAVEMWNKRGIRIIGQIPPSAVVVSAPDGADLRAPGVRWSGRLSAEDKISALVGADDEAPGAYVVEFYADVEMALARALVNETGMQLQDHPDLLPDQLLVLGTTGQVAALASWDEVAYVFPASADLAAGNHVLACAGAVSDAGFIGQYVKMGAGWSGDAQGNVALSYVFTALTPKLPASTVQSEVARAFGEWAKYAPLSFQPGTGAAAPRTIAIQFASGPHGDGYNFDGPGGTLAHTFYPAPPNLEPIAGDMHFDADEAWDNRQKIDLYSVALHEAGHALGLAHSDKPGAVMYPYYRLNAQLADDDIAGIRAIYAAPATTPQPAPLTVSVTTPNASSITVATSWIAMTGTVNGGTGTPQVSWTSSQGSSGKADGTSIWSIPVVPLNVGTNIVTVTATDGAGTVASRVITVSRQASTGNPGNPSNPPAPPPAGPPASPPTAPSGAPPNLKITSPAFTIVSTSAPAIAISGTASADVTQVTWSTSTASSGTADGTSTWSASVPLVPGTNTVTVKAFNAAGSSWRSLTVVRR